MWHIDRQGGTVYGLNKKSVTISGSILSNYNLIYEEATWQVVGGNCSDKLTIFPELHQEKYVPNARDRIGQLQTSAQQPSLATPFAVIRNKFVSS